MKPQDPDPSPGPFPSAIPPFDARQATLAVRGWLPAGPGSAFPRHRRSHSRICSRKALAARRIRITVKN